MKSSNFVAACVAALGISACGTPTPSCGDDQVIGLLEEIVQDQLRDALADLVSPYGASFGYEHFAREVAQGNQDLAYILEEADALLEQHRIQVAAIRTIDSPAKSASSCAADLKIHGPRGMSTTAITYTAQRTDDGKSIYVEVQGL